MRNASTNIDLIQPDPRPEPDPRTLDSRIADLIPMLKARPPRIEHIFDNGPCRPEHRDHMRAAIRDRDATEIGNLVLGYFDSYCKSEANDLAYSDLMDDLTTRDYEVLADIGEERRFRV